MASIRDTGIQGIGSISVEVNIAGVIQGSNKSKIKVRSRPSTSGSVIKTITNKQSVKITKEHNGWFYIPSMKGWVKSSDVKISNQLISSSITTVEKAKNAERAEKEKKERKKRERLEKELSAIETSVSSNQVTDASILNGLIMTNLNGVYGIPYQFMENVDPRLGNSVMGRKYAEKIISKMPLLCLTPGKVEFMSNYSKREKTGVLKSLAEVAKTGNIETDISSIINENGRYFTFAFDYPGYFDYVNGLCRAGARFLDIHNLQLNIGGTQALAKNFDWSKALNKDLKATFTSQEFIGFYIDSSDSVSETFNNDTTQSQLSSTVNGFSDLAREVGFLLGAGAGKELQVMDADKQSQVMQSIDDITNKYLNGSNLIKNIANNFSTIAIGGKLLFPEIWSDSSFSRSFDINIKLRCPDPNVVSWYLDIYVPLCHLIGLAAGHQTDNANGYYSPFLVRAFYKGLFNIDMGIITDMSITKGKESAWNVDGLPTEVDINLTIKDLYNMLSITPGTEPKNFVTNSILMDYIANTCGININQMDIERSLHIYYILTKDKIIDLPSKTQRRFQNAIDTFAMNMYNAALNKLLI